MKSLPLIAVASVLVFALSACGGSGNNNKQPVGATQPAQSEPAQNQPAGAPHNTNP